MNAAAARNDQPIPRSENRRKRLLGLFALLVLVLVSVFSSGFFLYAVLVIAGALIISAAVAITGLLGIKVERRLSQSEIHLGEYAEVTLTVRNDKHLASPWLFWQDHVEESLDREGPACMIKTLGPGHTHTLSYRLHSTRRCLARVGPAVLESSGPLGLVRRFAVNKEVQFLTVMPSIIPIDNRLPAGRRPIHQVPRRRSLFEDPSRFLGIRQYRPGDSRRRIHWRATARSNRLQVKLYEPSVLGGVLMALDMGRSSYPVTRSDPGGIDPLLELAVNTAASLGEYVLKEDQAVGLIANGTDAAERYPEDWRGETFRRLDEALDKTRTRRKITAFRPVELAPAKGQWQRDRLVHALARLMPSDALTLPELLDAELPRLPRNQVLMVITPELGPALGQVLESLLRSSFDLGVIWIRPMDAPSDAGAAAVPRGVPVRAIRHESEIPSLGGQAL